VVVVVMVVVMVVVVVVAVVAVVVVVVLGSMFLPRPDTPAKVNGVELKTCLGDLYSVNWMEDSDSATGEHRTPEAGWLFRA
jgi:hypothetical protein